MLWHHRLRGCWPWASEGARAARQHMPPGVLPAPCTHLCAVLRCSPLAHADTSVYLSQRGSHHWPVSPAQCRVLLAQQWLHMSTSLHALAQSFTLAVGAHEHGQLCHPGCSWVSCIGQPDRNGFIVVLPASSVQSLRCCNLQGFLSMKGCLLTCRCPTPPWVQL